MKNPLYKLINKKPSFNAASSEKKTVSTQTGKIPPTSTNSDANPPTSTTNNSPPVEGKPKINDPNFDIFRQNLNMLDTIAPEYIETDFNHVKINDTYFRTLFVAGYPRFVTPGWLESMINFNSSLDIAFYIYPIEGKSVLDDLRRKITEMEAEIATDLERGKIVDPNTQAKLEDALTLQEQLVKGAERFFEFAFYITIPAASLEELNHITKQVESTLGSLLALGKYSTLDMNQGFSSTLPLGFDKLAITRNMDSTSLATTFPLTSAELSSDEGVLYGINSQNESFIIFDRFTLENSNMTIFATSGAGKCVGYSTPILYQNNGGETKFGKLGKVADDLIKKGCLQKFDEESEGVTNPNIKIFSYDKNLRGGWSKVTAVSRKTSPNTLFKVITRSGREIQLTADHSLLILNQGIIIPAGSDQIKKGSFVPVPRKISFPSRSLNKLNVASLLKSGKNTYVSHNNRVGLRQSIKKCSLPSTIPLNKDFFKLLGLFIAEGTVLPQQAVVSSHSEEIINLLRKYYESLNINNHYQLKNKKRIGIRVTTRVFSDLLSSLGVSGNAGSKGIPPIVFSTSEINASSFLQAYFEGDGTVQEHEIAAVTKSKKLASDLSYLLFRFGIVARISNKLKRATNVKSSVKKPYYQVTISGQEDIGKFIKKIGFISKRKNLKAKSLLKKGNTNLDTIPELTTIFRDIYDVLYASSEIPAPKKFSEIKLGIFKPSRKNLLSIIKQIEARIQEIENLEKDGLLTLKNLPTTEEIIQKGKNKDVNSQLWQTLKKSWWTIRKEYPPKLANALLAATVTHQVSHTKENVAQALYRSFHKTGLSMRKFDYSLWTEIVNGRQNPLYQKVINARNYLNNQYRQQKLQLGEIKKKVAWLKTLATSDLYWDEIVKIEKIKADHKYVYDFQVENEVFLAGYAGMFVHNSYFVKLESVRSLMLGTEVIVIDPEAEYKALTEAVGGEYISFSFKSKAKINPFDLSQVKVEGENALGLKILTLHSFFKVIMGELDPIKEALLDRSLVMTYRNKGITQDPETQSKEPPLMEDLYKTLIGMETRDALDLASRIERFVRGSFVGIFDQQTNIDINNPFTVFSVKDMQEVLRPIAMFMILDFIWTRVQRDLKRRLLIVDEAWHMMKHKDSAQFLWSVVKRARKYYLGLTTITQDVEDFLAQDIGKAIVTNSALRVLLKQSPAAIDKIGEVFYLSQGEKQLLLAANIGEGIFFAGPHHAPIRVVASSEEHKLITTKPEELISQAPTQPPKDQSETIGSIVKQIETSQGK